MFSLPSQVTTLILPTVDSNLVSLFAMELLLASFEAELHEEVYDNKLLPIAAAVPTYGIYISKIDPKIAILLRRSQVQFGQRKKYFEQLKSLPVALIGVGSLPIYLKTDTVLSKGRDTEESTKFGIESFVVYCENGDIVTSAAKLALSFMTWLEKKEEYKRTSQKALNVFPKVKESGKINF